MLETQNHGNRFGAVAWPIPTPVRMRDRWLWVKCVCVKKEMKGAATAYWVEKDITWSSVVQIAEMLCHGFALSPKARQVPAL